MDITSNMTEIYDWNVNQKKNKLFRLILVLACLIMVAIPIAVTPMVYPLIDHIGIGYYSIIWLALIISMVVIHEGLHGIFFYAYSKHVNFGIRWKTKVGPTPYATANGQFFTKRQYQIIGLAPQLFTIALISITWLLTSLPALAIVIMVAATNLGGGSADLWAVYELAKLPDNIMVEDTKDGFRVWANIPEKS